MTLSHRLVSGIIVISMSGGAAPALASGGIACSSESGPAKFEVSVAMGHDFGSAIFDLTGTLEAGMPGVAKDLAQVHYGIETPNQVWLDADLLYFELLVARPGGGPYGSSDLVIKTKAVDEGMYEGIYTLTITDTANDGPSQYVMASGTASCVAD